VNEGNRGTKSILLTPEPYVRVEEVIPEEIQL
jgi:hypothetical protein